MGIQYNKKSYLFSRSFNSAGLCSFLLCLFVGLVTTDDTPSCSAHYAVSTHNVTCNSAYRGAFQATFSLGSLRKKRSATYQSKDEK